MFIYLYPKINIKSIYSYETPVISLPMKVGGKGVVEQIVLSYPIFSQRIAGLRISRLEAKDP
jgi:hypothetical protein